MQNLIKIQEDLKNVPLQAVMSYVDGRNPMVPPYLALTELNRRKQVQQSAAAQQQPQGTIKDQIQQQTGLMALQAGRQQAAQQNMAQNMASVPQPGAAPAGPVQAAAPVVKAAEGGLMRMPMRSDMFKADSYAGGGIVAFNGKSSSKVKDEDEEEYEDPLARLSGVDRESRALDALRIAQSPRTNYREVLGYKTAPPAAPAAPASAPPASTPPSPAVPPANTNPPKPSNLGGYASLLNMKPRSTSLEDIFKEQQAADRLTGVVSPEQRYSKSDEMFKKLNEQIMNQRGQQGIERLAAAMKKGSEAKRTSDAMAGFGSGYFETTAKQRELNNKQDEAFATLERTKEKEADAIRRGDSDAIIKTKREREKAEFELSKAKAEVQYRQESIAQKTEAAEGKLDVEKEKAFAKANPGYGMMLQREGMLALKLSKDPNDQKTKEDLYNLRQEIERTRRDRGLYSGGAPAASSAPQGKLVTNKDGSLSYQR
jgi:hypothetical protein